MTTWEMIQRDYAEKCHYDRREIIEVLYAELVAARKRIEELEKEKEAR